jgi:hypothetical protein
MAQGVRSEPLIGRAEKAWAVQIVPKDFLSMITQVHDSGKSRPDAEREVSEP